MRRSATPFVVLLVTLASLVGALLLVLRRDAAGEILVLRRPDALWLLAGPVLVAWACLWRGVWRRGSLWFSEVRTAAQQEPGRIARLRDLPAIFRVCALVLLVLALVRPQSFVEEATQVDGIDIMFVLDLSRSMSADDMPRTRLDAGQRQIRDFLKTRGESGDRVGLVVFAREAMLVAPLTLDYRSFETLVASVAIGDVPDDGTALGDALGLALAQLQRSGSESQTIVLLSDGDWNQTKFVAPEEVSSLAAQRNVRIFSILLANESGESAQLLQGMATATKGAFFHAANLGEFSAGFEEIRERLKQSTRTLTGQVPHLEFFARFIWPAVLLLLFEFLLTATRLRRFP